MLFDNAGQNDGLWFVDKEIETWNVKSLLCSSCAGNKSGEGPTYLAFSSLKTVASWNIGKEKWEMHIIFMNS